jgi:hypothetical protein
MITITFKNGDTHKVDEYTFATFYQQYRGSIECISGEGEQLIALDFKNISFEGNLAFDTCVLENCAFTLCYVRRLNFSHLINCAFSVGHLMSSVHCNTKEKKLIRDLMIWDAQNHPYPKRFNTWAKSRRNRCPYAGLSLHRAARFHENWSYWPGWDKAKNVKINPYNLLMRVMKANGNTVTWTT